MKKIVQGLFVVLTMLLLGSTNLKAQTNLEQALKHAKEENKQVLINFSGSDWCRSCILLKKTILNTDEFIAFAEKELIILDVDFPRLKKNKLSEEQTAKNEALAAKYNENGQFPTIILMDKDGKVLGKTGYKKLSPEQYVNHIKSFLK